MTGEITMREALKKTANVCKLIFGYGIMITLFAGGATFVGYLAALAVGGETAGMICTVIYKEIIPVIIRVSTWLILLGTVSMYLAGEKSLTVNK